jgi:hypothetical protein
MKKHLLLLIVLCLSFAMQAKNTLVTTKTQFTTAWGTLANGDTITVAYNGGVILNTGAVNLPAAGGLITVRGQYPDSLPIIQSEFDGVTLADGVTTGLIFENLHLQYRSPDGTSGQVIYFNKKYANMTKLIFRNCEVSKTVRSLFRSVKPDSIIGPPIQRWASCGDLEYFEMSNCKVHNTTLTSGNNWPLVYFGHLPVEVNFKNNTFYDLPYLKSIFTMNYADANQGRNAIINFENNTVSFTPTQGALIATGSFLGQEAQFNFKNNVFIVPNWINATNLDMSTFAKPKILTARYGLVTASNNLVSGYNSWGSGQSIDADGQGGFVTLDTIPQNTMESLGVNWTDFANPQNGDYSYLFTNPLAKAGSTGGPIGDPRWVLSYKNPRNLEVVSDLATAVVTPSKGVYENATSVTVSASTVVGYVFVNWRDTLGNVISAANPYKFDIIANTKLVAHYDALMTRAVTVVLKGTNTATYTITPVRTTYYAGDIITTTLNTHAINNFLGWSDGKTTLTRIDTLNADLNVTAKFNQLPYMLSWDFSHLTGNNATYSSLAANVALDTLNRGRMNLILGPDTLAANFGTRNNKFTGLELNNCALRKSFNAKTNPDFLYIKFSTKGKTGLKVSSAIATDNNIHKIQKMEYSLDSLTYKTFVTDSMPSDSASLWSKWKTLQGNLPVEAQDKDVVYVRWISDPTSTLYAVASSDKKFEYAYISKIVVLADLDMGGASWRVNPFESYTAGQEITSVPGIKLTLGGGTNVWSTLDSTFTFNHATYISSINGTVNPTTASNQKFSASGIPPTVGAFYKFDVTVDGALDAAIIINAAKASYIVENTTAMTGYSNFQVTVKTYARYSIPVKAGSSYYFFSEGSKMGMMGFQFTPGGAAVKNQLKTVNTVYSSGNSLFVKAANDGQVVVYDMLGKVVRSGKVNVGLNEITNLKKGTYMVRIGTENIKAVL